MFSVMYYTIKHMDGVTSESGEIVANRRSTWLRHDFEA